MEKQIESLMVSLSLRSDTMSKDCLEAMQQLIRERDEARRDLDLGVGRSEQTLTSMIRVALDQRDEALDQRDEARERARVYARDAALGIGDDWYWNQVEEFPWLKEE